MLLDSYQRPKQLISMTPLIDVVFILLLFFMLSSTFNRTKQIEVSTSSGGQPSQISESVKLLITEPGFVRINDNVISVNSDEFTKQLKEYAASGDKLFLAARSHISVQEIIHLLDSAKHYGITNLSLSESVQP